MQSVLSRQQSGVLHRKDKPRPNIEFQGLTGPGIDQGDSVEKTDKIVAQYQQLFKTLGCLKTSYHIKTDPEIRPTICPPRNQPVALMDRIKEELDEMEALQVIRKIDEPTERVNSMVVVEKPKTHKL